MMLRNTRESYGLVTRSLHAVIAVLVLGLIPVGWYMSGLSDEEPAYWRLLELHETLGLGVLMLAVARMIWLAVSPAPALSPALAAWERNAARLAHTFFRVALAVIPVIGFLCVASDGESVKLYELVEIPPVGQFDKGVRDVLFDLHAYLAYGCAALIAVHVLAALKHHFLDRSASLRRIVF